MATWVIYVSAQEVERKNNIALLEFSVSDTGCGIPEDARHTLFQPFSQIDSSITRKHGGSGLGLSIVRSLATRMGGDVGVESEVGKGSRFWFRIQAAVHAKESEEVEAAAAVEDLPLTGNILIVDDNSTNRTIVDTYLSKSSANTLCVEDGQQALDILMKGEQIEIILMDLQMPVMDGYTATRLIREWETNHHQPRHPIIAMTSNAFEEDRQRCLSTGMDDFIAKPIQLTVMKKMISKWLIKQASAALPETNKVIDESLVIHQIRALIPLLEEREFDALDRYNELQRLLADTTLAKEFIQANHCMEQYHFGGALQELRAIMSSKGWEESPHE